MQRPKDTKVIKSRKSKRYRQYKDQFQRGNQKS